MATSVVERSEVPIITEPAWLNTDETVEFLDVDVTAKCVATGIRYDPSACMIAIAVGNDATVAVFDAKEGWTIRVADAVWKVPRAVQRRINRWDHGYVVRPFRFRAKRLR